jgi:hypothetical protein
VASGYTKGNGIGAEVVGTFVLVYVVYYQVIIQRPQSLL